MKFRELKDLTEKQRIEELKKHFVNAEILDNHDHGASIKLYDNLEMFIRWYGNSGNKGSVSFYPTKELRRKYDLSEWKLGFKIDEVGFNADLEIGATCKRLQARIDKFMPKLKELNARVAEVINEEKEEKRKLQEQKDYLESLGFDVCADSAIIWHDTSKTPRITTEISTYKKKVTIEYIQNEETYKKLLKFIVEEVQNG